jgi:hypothetical protein
MATLAWVDLLWHMPEVLVMDLLLLWVEVDGIGRLDSAVCCTNLRGRFLEVVCSPGFVLTHHRCKLPQANTEDISKHLEQFTAWILARRIAVTKFTVTGAFTDNCARRLIYLMHAGKHIQKIAIRSFGVQNTCLLLMNNLCELCPNVLFLKCQEVLSGEALEHISVHWKQLISLRLTVNRYTWNQDAPSQVQEGLLRLAETCQSLTELELWGSVTPVIFTAFAQVCSPNIQHLSVVNIALEAEAFPIIATRFAQLRVFRASPRRMGDTALITLAAGCPKLTEVTIGKQVTDVGITAVARNGALTTLCIESCHEITDDGVKTFADCCPLVQRINVGGCRHLTDATLITIGQHCHNLRELRIGATNMTAPGLQAIAAGCPLLETLKAEECYSVGYGIAAIARGCPRLRCLIVEQHELTMCTVWTLVECCPLLEELSMRGDGKVGDNDIAAIASGCRQLRRLDITGTTVTERGLASLKRYCKQLRHVKGKEVAGQEEMYADAKGYMHIRATFSVNVVAHE